MGGGEKLRLKWFGMASECVLQSLATKRSEHEIRGYLGVKAELTQGRAAGEKVEVTVETPSALLA